MAGSKSVAVSIAPLSRQRGLPSGSNGMIISRLFIGQAIFSHGLCHAIAVMPDAIFTSGSPWQQSGRSLDEAVTKFNCCSYSIADNMKANRSGSRLKPGK
jgi:hypothetical protein